ncbi:MAG: leucine--tRNA ligase [Oscillospiraceae bacterium]|nr:leucine--tRNA ligase [Oscillospiraceae bacterium]
MAYDFKLIEKKWQAKWNEEKAFQVTEDKNKQKYYVLIEFPYPSGQGLHVGHPRPYVAMDIVSRKKRMEGFNVLFPMGWDAFGLPTENYAIKNKLHPKPVTKDNIVKFKRQLQAFGLSLDWSREVDTTDPEYYKWTQWIFLQLFKNNLAYKKEMAVNWCTSCKCVLANEEVVDNGCERCGSEVVRREKSQWMLKITAYAQKLLDGMENLDFIDRVKTQTANWLGRSVGAEVDFAIKDSENKLRVFTTRPDTLFGATYMVIAPEHPIINNLKDKIENYSEIEAYRNAALKKSDFERSELSNIADKEKTGVEISGIKAVNPVNNQEIPVFVSDYVLISYGTGAIMAVPGHDERDYAFAKTFGLPIIEVVKGGDITEAAFTDTETGILVNSGFLDGLEVDEAKKKITEFLEDKKIGEEKINYKLRDWVFSRQRYWGEPIPIIICDDCGFVALDESELPLLLPDVESYEPTDTGESPLSKITDWVKCKCPKCGKDAERETDTMPQWAGSSWYFLRYCDPDNKDFLASKEKLDYWMPVDWYNGGMEHTTLHLLYSRFWALFLHDIGVMSCPEPYLKRTSHGMILAEDGGKMSKSRPESIVNPDDVIAEYGADTFRLYEMFIGDFEKSTPWATSGMKGCRRFAERVYGLIDIAKGGGVTPELEVKFHRTIKKVTHDIDNLKMNTAIAGLMTLVNDIYDNNSLTIDELKIFLTLLCPFAPHISEELWFLAGGKGLLSLGNWVDYDENKTKENAVEIAVQINGRVRDKIIIEAGLSSQDAINTAKNSEKVKELLNGKTIVKEIAVQDKLVNIVVR